jgi:hypothetical protein
MKNFIRFTFLLITLLPQKSFSFYREIETITYDGKIYSIRIVKHQPVQIYIFDQDQVQIDLSTIDVELLNAKDDNDLESPVKLRIVENHLIITSEVNEDLPYRLEIKSLNDGKKETFNVKFQQNMKRVRQALLGSQ